MLGCPGFGVLGVLPPLCDLICLGMAPYSTPYARLLYITLQVILITTNAKKSLLVVICY